MRLQVSLIVLLCTAAQVHADTITIRADEWLPYNGPLSRKPPGYMIEMADAIAATQGHTIEYKTMPWDDAVASSRKGDIDCVVGALKSDAEGFMFPEESWGDSLNGLFALTDTDWTYTDIESFSSVRVAVIAGYSYSEEIDAYVEANKADPNKVVIVNSTGRALMNAVSRLVSRKADVIIEDVNVAASTFAKMNMADRMKSVGVVGEPEPLYIACTPASPRGKQFADMFSAGTVELRSSGKLAEILEKYGLEDWKK
ncbi:MAG: transporter substrate-binding domain-containing protein [Ahniella sp.]|nr:transporter substrate-binding domain-containing protein [Ahniella sp.]